MGQEPIANWIHRVTEASQLFLQQNGPHCWLIKQSIFTHFQRLAALSVMPWFQALRGAILDIGAGTGALSLDLAWGAGANGFVTAIDQDTQALEIARSLAERVGLRIAVLPGDVSALPVEDATQDLAIARFLFQHLPDPTAALLQMRRVTRPGGRIAIIDVDDSISLSEPSGSNQLAALRNAIRIAQLQRGGNRLIGRELYRLMRDVGLTSIEVIVVPRVRLGLQSGRSAKGEEYQIERLLTERERLVSSGLMTARDFDLAVTETEQRFAQDLFEMEAEFIATGLVPAA